MSIEVPPGAFTRKRPSRHGHASPGFRMKRLPRGKASVRRVSRACCLPCHACCQAAEYCCLSVQSRSSACPIRRCRALSPSYAKHCSEGECAMAEELTFDFETSEEAGEDLSLDYPAELQASTLLGTHVKRDALISAMLQDRNALAPHHGAARLREDGACARVCAAPLP